MLKFSALRARVRGWLPSKHKEFWRDTPWCVPRLSHSPMDMSHLSRHMFSVCPATFCPLNLSFHINRTLPGHSDHQIPKYVIFLHIGFFFLSPYRTLPFSGETLGDFPGHSGPKARETLVAGWWNRNAWRVCVYVCICYASRLYHWGRQHYIHQNNWCRWAWRTFMTGIRDVLLCLCKFKKITGAQIDAIYCIIKNQIEFIWCSMMQWITSQKWNNFNM